MSVIEFEIGWRLLATILVVVVLLAAAFTGRGA